MPSTTQWEKSMNETLPPLPHWCEEGSPFAQQMQAYARAAIQAIAPVPAVPEGWKLVPVAATPEMLKAIGNKWDGANAATWQRVLSAAPQPAPQEQIAFQTPSLPKFCQHSGNSPCPFVGVCVNCSQPAPQVAPKGFVFVNINGRQMLARMDASVNRTEAQQVAQQEPAQDEPIKVTTQMALAFHRAVSDASVSDQDVKDTKIGLEAAFATARSNHDSSL
jgi:hypothetical protein